MGKKKFTKAGFSTGGKIKIVSSYNFKNHVEL